MNYERKNAPLFATRVNLALVPLINGFSKSTLRTLRAALCDVRGATKENKKVGRTPFGSKTGQCKASFCLLPSLFQRVLTKIAGTREKEDLIYTQRYTPYTAQIFIFTFTTG